jgi:hypothetical protein
MKKILSIALVFLVGALIGNAFGFNAGASGAVSLFGSLLINAPKQVAFSGLDLSEVTAQLGAYFRYYSNQVWAQITKGQDFEAYMRAVPNVKSRYITTTSTRTEFLQAFQKGFQAKGGVAMVPYENTIYPIKMDHTQEDLHALHATYLAFLQDETKLPTEIPFVKWLVDTHIIPGITEEIRKMSVIGVYEAPVENVAGASINSANGVFTIVENEITAGNIVPILTGAITPENTVDKVELFHRSLPTEYRTQPGVIFAASDLVEDYKFGYRAEFGTNRDFEGPTVKLWGTQKELVGLDALNGSSRLLYTPTGAKGNLLKMYDKIVMPTPQVQLEKRDVHILADMHRGWGFETLQNVFTNDVGFAEVEEEGEGGGE